MARKANGIVMDNTAKYECVIGLEVHTQLLTKSKAFSSDEAAYGAAPNTLISPVSLGHPGTLPVLNKAIIEDAIMLGLAMNCNINKYNEFARKNYFYADLPKGYQISQFNTPICSGGNVKIHLDSGDKVIGITRIHIEEDSGKSIHDLDPFNTLIDLNRAGVPLLEIVSEPDMRDPEEAYQYLIEVRKLVRYLGICDGNMEEGSLRCDANVSVRLWGAKAFGQKVEVKNMNSIRNVKRALEYEVIRQVEVLEKGGKIVQDTRSFDAAEGITFAMRSKEDANDYRYFTEPDLPPVVLTSEQIEQVRMSMPPLPEELFNKYIDQLKLSAYDAGILTDDKATALYFDQLIGFTNAYKAAANWMMGPVRSWVNERAIGMEEFPLEANQLAMLIDFVETGSLSFSVAAHKLFPVYLDNPATPPGQLAADLNLLQNAADDELQAWIKAAMDTFPDKVEAYRAGNKNLLGLFMGDIMKRSKGKADPQKTNQMLRKELER